MNILINNGTFSNVYYNKILRMVEKHTYLYDKNYLLFSNNIKELFFLCLLKEYIFGNIPLTLCKYNNIILYKNKIKILYPYKGKTLNNFKFSLPIIFDILKAIHFLHYNDISHGDIKPNNILVNKNDAILIDYGTICFNHNEEYYNRCTLYYISPEELLQKKFLLSTDIWSVGCTIYEYYTKKIFIIDLIGESIISFKKLEHYFNTKITQEKIYKLLDKNIDDYFILDLLKKMLILDVNKRCKINELLFLKKNYPVKLNLTDLKLKFLNIISNEEINNKEEICSIIEDIIINNKIIIIKKEQVKSLINLICIIPKILYKLKIDIVKNVI